MMTAGIIRVLLIVDIAAMAIWALVYLRQRRMSRISYLFWGVLAAAVPVIGPFFVIASRPGVWDPTFSVRKDLNRLAAWMRCLLPDPPPERARARSRRQVR